MIQFTTIMHSNSDNWILIRHTELVDQYRTENSSYLRYGYECNQFRRIYIITSPSGVSNNILGKL